MIGKNWEQKYKEIHDQYANESDRAFGILLAEFLSQFLAERLAEYFIDDASNKKLFNGKYAPLSTFSARIDIAYALGLLTQDMYKDLNMIRKIRNHFAHHPFVINFDVPPIRDYCNELSTAKGFLVDDPHSIKIGEEKKIIGLLDFNSPRMQFTFTAIATMGLLERILDSNSRCEKADGYGFSLSLFNKNE